MSWGYVTDQQSRPVKPFTVVYRTAAGYVAASMDYDSYDEAEAAARRSVEETGRSHWVAELTSEVRVDLSVIRSAR